MYKVAGLSKEYTLSRQENGFVINNEPFHIDIQQLSPKSWLVFNHNKRFIVDLIENEKGQNTYVLLVNGHKYTCHVKDPLHMIIDQLGMANLNSTKADKLNAPMPGLVLDVLVKTGDLVKKGEPLIILEAMKMENILKAAHDGKVAEIMVSNGESVEKNQALLRF